MKIAAAVKLFFFSPKGHYFLLSADKIIQMFPVLFKRLRKKPPSSLFAVNID